MNSSDNSWQELKRYFEDMGEMFQEVFSHQMGECGVTPSSLCKELDVSTVTVNNWLTGKNLPTSNYIYHINRVFGSLNPDRVLVQNSNLFESWVISRRFRALIPYLLVAEKEGDIDAASAILEQRIWETEQRTSPADQIAPLLREPQIKQFSLFAPALDFYMNRQGIKQKHLANKIPVEPAAVHNWRKAKRLPDSEMVYFIGKNLDLAGSHKAYLANCWQTTNHVKGILPYMSEVKQHGSPEIIDGVHEGCVSEVSRLRLPTELFGYIKSWHSSRLS